MAHFVFAFKRLLVLLYVCTSQIHWELFQGKAFHYTHLAQAKEAGVICACSTHPDLTAHYSPLQALYFSSAHLLAILPLAKYASTLWALHRSSFLQVANSRPLQAQTSPPLPAEDCPDQPI